jgi:PAS domain S-box-containing protein
MNPDSGPLITRAMLRQPMGSVRLVIALFTITAAVTKLLYDRFLPNLRDLDEVRWGIIGLGAIFFVTTFFSAKRWVVISSFSFVLYFSTLLYLLAFVGINQFDASAVMILILVLGVSTIIVDSLFFYAMQCALVLGVSVVAYFLMEVPDANFIAFLNLVIALGVFGIVIAVRLKLISHVRNSNSNLEKLNVLSIVANKSGEIVFVSPSARHLLGLNPQDLLKNGWWTQQQVKDGWISKEYILNYPNIIPKEIVSVETNVTGQDGKTIWLSWANSLLPNGNYMGVAIDITKYKQG